MGAARGSADQAGLREWIGLAVLALPALLVSIDVSVMILALPHIGTGLGADSVQQLWIMDIYGFMLSGCLVTMGSLGDRIGRRKLLMIGGAAFSLASLLAAFSPNAGMLIAARALLGIAGATVSPSTLALIGNMFRDPKQRSLAIGIWFACSMGGMALGPVVGGAMLERFWWGSVFLLGLPVMILLLATAPFLLPEYRRPDAARIDLPSVGLSLGAILPVILGLKEIAKGGVQAAPVLAIAAGLAIGWLFWSRQRKLADPLIDLRLFGSPGFRAALGGMFGVTLTGAIMLFLAQYLQFVQGLSPLHAGLYMLPGIAASMAGMLISPLLARRIRPARLIAGGLAAACAGCLLFTQAGPESGIPAIVAGYVLFSLGASPLPGLSSDLVVGSAPPDQAGSAASLLQTGSEFAYALGIASLGSLATFVYRGQVAPMIPAAVPEAASQASRDSLIGAAAAAEGLPDSLRSALMDGAKEAFASSMHAVAVICGAIMLLVAVLVSARLRHLRPIGHRVSVETE
ncbi:MFS transporter [Cohnella caldifontis]|uniref:MFS transporter n=1 Tax=Cohnella caldifontis TaxID=3027471 RepID=UPI0023EBFB61|nr:MFS transporter [Cohnella sp. YIM B05605]